MRKRSNYRAGLNLLRTMVLCCLLPFFSGVAAFAQDPSTLETSVVLLLIKTEETTIIQDPYFELLEQEDELLVPVNRLTAYLNLEVSYFRKEEKVVLASKASDKWAEIYLDEKIYRIDGQSLLNCPPPVFFNGDIYVGIPFLASFLEAEINWDFSYQALSINVGADMLKQSPAPIRPEQQVPEPGREVPPKEGPTFALSSIRYQLGVEHRKEAGEHEALTGFFKIRTDGYAGEWTLSAAASGDYDFYNHAFKPELTLLRGKYQQDGELIIIGNTTLDLENTIAEQDLWGILYMIPDEQIRSELVAYTDVSGPAAAGDQVLLYVNDRLWQTQQLTADGNYLFRDVPLRINRVNKIRSVIQKENGETIEATQKIAASPRIMKKDGNDLLVTVGLYKPAEVTEWEGVLVSYRQRKAVTDNLTFEQETTVSAPFVNFPELSYIGSDTGVAFRINNNLICTLDWMVGGEIESEVRSGFESSLLYCLENGYFEGVILYVPTAVSLGVDTQPGQGGKILSELELREDLILNTEGYLLEATPNAHPWSLDGARLILTKRFGSYGQNSIAGGIGKEWKTEDSDRGLFEAEETSFTIKHVLRERTVGTNTKVELVNADFFLDREGPFRLQKLHFLSDLTLAVTPNLLFGVALDTTNTWADQSYTGLDLSGEANTKWNVTDNTLLMGNLLLEGKKEVPSDAAFQVSELTTGLSLYQFLSRELTLFAEVKRTKELPFYAAAEDYRYTTVNLGLNYYTFDGKWQINGNLGYRSPVSTRRHPQWFYGLGLQRTLPSYYLLKVELQRLYDALWDEVPEDVIRLSLSRALGFADGAWKPFRYTEEDNAASISGVVYLDTNANGRFDEGDKPLSGIRIRVDGTATTSNEKGEYLFANLAPGIYRVEFHLPSLPANYTPVTGPQLIRLREQENFFIDFAVTANGSVSGKVFIDGNGNGRPDEDEKPVSWVEVVLDDGAQKAFTDEHGRFYFEGVPLGTHTLALDPASLPAGLRPVGPALRTFTLTEEELEVDGLALPLVPAD
ncbi:MAG TPA: hypothetical protein GXX33_09265 [Firmicutes bacterium]|nr:hypothetical protein [Bacillota bacterium]